ncbi:PD-(D/E)XK nuclease family protein [Legionella oakridgensis]|uniref:PD-(D/E)XK nuclease family protein n=1 Tax=Legionella oakridgensis TaxID=29423 RepID=UPI0003DE5935|nr:PD-(D/E)XK nuclease family protein [Legionella oakridgensis]ETO92617.1 putative DNA repair protein [Legionella oakridgensis RV-2-2007]
MPTTHSVITEQQDLFANMKNGAVAITPNIRLSHQLLHDFLKTQNTAAEIKPLCLPYQGFLHYLFKQIRHKHPHANHPIVLTQLQQYHLWKKILSHSEHPLVTEGLLHEIQEAWSHCQNWGLDSIPSSFIRTPQTLQFQQWQQQFQTELTNLNAITEDQLANYVVHHLHLLDIPAFIWVCFNDYTPQQQLLQQAFHQADCQQYHYDLPTKFPNTHQYAAKDTQDEYLQIIQWIKERLAANDQRIGVVVPDLENQSRRLQRLFQQQLPQYSFNLSLGKPLLNYPLVSHALNWLELDAETISNTKARLLLHSPYLGGAKTEFQQRTEALQTCKILQEAQISFPLLLKEFQRLTPALAKLLTTLLPYPKEAAPYQWISHFKSRLHGLGFPGEYSLNSSAYQCFQRLLALLDEFLQLSILYPVMTKRQALDSLRHMVRSTIFQEQKPASPIQLLGLLEACGCTFDSLWICGMTDQCLPQKTSLSAFIPIELQKRYRMPHALPEQELKFAQQLLQRLQNGCQDCFFSYPKLQEDRPNLPSPFIRDFPHLTIKTLPPPRPSLLCQRTDSYRIPLAANEQISGGTALLANQAKCPFRAFSMHRLHAKAGLKLSLGPDAKERGQILHKIMEKIWQLIGSQQQLLQLTQSEMDACITQVIQTTLPAMMDYRRYSFPMLLQDMEQERLQQLVKACLDWEKQRPPFKIAALEQMFTIQLADLDFHVRVDRIDQVGDKKWVIDYKSSLPPKHPWKEERPQEPQLLLYALLDNEINALLFIQLKNRKLTCHGLSEEPITVHGIQELKKEERWSVLQQQWHQQLTALANEFRLGDCSIQPMHETLCQQCDFPSLCRIELP